MINYPKYGKPFEAGKFYHIYNRAVGKERLFISDDNYHFFLRKFRSSMGSVISVYAYCLLSNHFHFLIKINDSTCHEEISERFRRFFISYSKSFNSVFNRKGSLFEKHLKRVAIDSDQQLLWTVYYIHRNPVHHRVTENYHSYKWSSLPVILSDKKTKLERDGALELFGGKESFLSFHDNNIEEDKLIKQIGFREDL